MALRIGVAGTGHWADTVHVPGLEQQTAVELVGVWGRNAATVDTVAKRHGIQGFTRFEDMLKEVDAVSFSVPPAVQAEIAPVAAEAGKHLLLEKPIAPTVTEAEHLAAAVEKNRVATVVFFTRRFVPAFESLLQEARKKSWTGVRVRQHTEAMLPGSPYANSTWRQAEGAALWDLGPHALSVMMEILGPIESISASRTPDRLSCFTAKHKGGAVSEVSLGLYTKPSEVAAEYRFRGADGDYVLPIPTFPRPEALATAAGELAANVTAGETRHRCDVRLGLEVVRVLAAADRSLATGGSSVTL